jgi:glucosamine--fructose-6-phosphate aminotransferase (isomerizing)
MNGINTKTELEASPDAWQRTIDFWERERFGLSGYKSFLFMGCGSSYHTAKLAAGAFRHLVGASAKAARASDVILSPERFQPENQPSLATVIARSGQTAEAIQGAREAARLGFDTLALTCSSEGELLEHCRRALVLSFLQERSIVATSSVSSFVLLLLLMAAGLAEDEDLLRRLGDLPQEGAGFLLSAPRREAEQFVTRVGAGAIGKSGPSNYNVFLGVGPCLTVALESALKMKEMALVATDAQQTLEFRHGPRALVDEQSLVVLFRTAGYEGFELPVLREASDWGARTLIVCEHKGFEVAETGALICPVGGKGETLKGKENGLGLGLIPLYLCVGQAFGLAKALARGIDPDHPRHLDYYVSDRAR